MEEEKKSLEQPYKLQSEKIARLRNALIIETDPSRKFQYEQQIQQEQNELKKLTDRLDEIEKQLQSVQSILAISELKSIQQKILILTAIPHGLRLDREIREIEEAIRRAVNRNLFEIRIITAVRSQDIRRAIAEEQPQIVHFCGHGLEDGSLLLEDEGGNNKPVSPQALASLFKLHVDDVKCVLLNACYSEKPAVAISQYINYVIGMNNPIQDRAAIEFARGFYDGLGYKNSGNQDVFQRAFNEAMVAIEMENLSQGEIPVLKKKF
ncbi:MAG: CHAT domain-containing protein [Nostochopsis sp.]